MSARVVDYIEKNLATYLSLFDTMALFDNISPEQEWPVSKAARRGSGTTECPDICSYLTYLSVRNWTKLIIRVYNRTSSQ